MSEPTKIRHITKAELAARGAAALSDRPNTRHPYGKGGLSAKELKEWFDQLAALIADRHNELLDILASPAAADHIGVESGIEGVGTLADFFRAMSDGTIADQALLVKLEDTTMTVQAATDEILRRIGSVNDKAFTAARYDEEKQEFVFTSESGNEVHMPFELSGGTAVEANPEDEATEQLSTVKIDGVTYSTGNAYALAKDNSYAGTETDFGKKLAELLGIKLYDGGAGDVDSDFPIYSGSTGDVEAHITFYINGTECLAKRGMTFAEWVESADNKGGWFIYEDGGIRDSDNAVLQLGGTDVKAENTIADGAHYEAIGV
jgi:hypothetical protein